MSNQWIAWAKEEIISLSKIVQEKNAEIDAMKKKYSEMRDGLNGVIQRQRISHNDYARATDREIDEAEERGARRLAEYIVLETEHPRFSVDDLMTIWKRLK